MTIVFTVCIDRTDHKATLTDRNSLSVLDMGGQSLSSKPCEAFLIFLLVALHFSDKLFFLENVDKLVVKICKKSTLEGLQ